MSDAPTTVPPQPPAGIQPGRFPAPLSSFVGRDEETASVVALLRREDIRLVTLTGPGGVGKTRLALHVGSLVAGDMPDGVWFVDLAPLADPALVVPTIARTLGLQAVGDARADAGLTAFLHGKRALLVLDNLEQVLGAAPDVARLLEDCPGVTVLATSREPLAVAGEQQYPVPPLATGPASAAVRLFADRARAGDPVFAMDEATEDVVAEICARLDGLPLAIELAAARTKALPPAELLARLDRRMPLLTGTGRDLPARHRTMRGAIAWSHDLLPAQEQALFRRLAVFAGGFTLEAAGAVAAGPGEGVSGDVLDGVASLVDKSLLVRRAGAGGAARYAMLETVREYASEQLDAHGETEAVRARHAAWVAAFAGGVEPLGPVPLPLLARLDDEHDNARAALRWAIDTGDAAVGLRIAVAFVRAWQLRGYLDEGRRWLAEVLALEGPAPDELRAAGLWVLGWFAWRTGDLDAAEAATCRALELAEHAGDRRVESQALLAQGWYAEERGDAGAADRLYRRALELARAHGDGWVVGVNLASLGITAGDRGDLAAAGRCYEEALPLVRRAGDPSLLAHLTGAVAWLARQQGDPRRAAALDRERLAINRALDFREQQADCCQAAAGVALTLGHPEQAARLAAAAARAREEIGFVSETPYRQQLAATAAAIRGALGEAAFLREWAAGRAVPLADAVADADAVFAVEEAGASLSNPVPPPVDAAAAALAEHRLTPREAEVLRLLAHDRSNQQIADALFLSRRTVHKHVENVLAKLGVDSRAGAAVWAVRHGLDEPDAHRGAHHADAAPPPRTP